jgi:putative transposase
VALFNCIIQVNKKKHPLKQDRLLVAESFIKEGVNKVLALKTCQIKRSSYYYKSKALLKVGRPCSTHTYQDGTLVADGLVVKDIIALLSDEFVDYGYFKTAIYLRDEHKYYINHKKVYRLMRDNGLLNLSKNTINRTKRQWVSELVPQPTTCFSYLEFDIKFIYILGKRTNAQVLTVIDVFSRWILGHIIKWKIDFNDVIALFDIIFISTKMPEKFYVRNDNGSQFIADLVQKYFKDKNVIQEFTKPATPQQNAHIESYHSIMENAVCRKFEFMDLKEAQDTLNRFRDFYNYKRIHSGIGYKSPYKYLLQKGVDMNIKPL